MVRSKHIARSVVLCDFSPYQLYVVVLARCCGPVCGCIEYHIILFPLADGVSYYVITRTVSVGPVEIICEMHYSTVCSVMRRCVWKALSPVSFSYILERMGPDPPALMTLIG